MDRLLRLQDNVLRIVAQAVSEKLLIDGYMVTVTAVDLSPDQKRLKIFVSVLPDKFFGSALTKLRALSPLIRGELARRAGLRQAPKLHWLADDREKHAAELEPLFQEISTQL